MSRFRLDLVTIVGLVASLLLLAAGVAKAVDLNAFRLAVGSWQTIPEKGVAIVMVLVPLLEMLLGALFILDSRRRMVALGSILFVATITVWFFVERSQNPDASCGCLGKLMNRAASLDSSGAHLAINGGMIACWAFFLVAKRPASATNTPIGAAPSSSARPGFTMVELLVTISIIAVLVSLSVWGISAARRRAWDSVDQSLLRSSAMAVLAYAGDARGSFPYHANPDGSPMTLVDAALPIPQHIPYFDAHQVWHISLSQGGYVTSWVGGEFLSPFRRSDRTPAAAVLSDYWLPCVFFATRDYWNFSTRMAAPAQLGGVREAEVAWPSFKSLIAPQFVGIRDGIPLYASGDTAGSLAFVDGSVVRVSADRRGPDLGNHGSGPVFLGGYDQYAAGLHTVGGAAGRDRLSE